MAFDSIISEGLKLAASPNSKLGIHLRTLFFPYNGNCDISIIFTLSPCHVFVLGVHLPVIRVYGCDHLEQFSMRNKK